MPFQAEEHGDAACALSDRPEALLRWSMRGKVRHCKGEPWSEHGRLYPHQACSGCGQMAHSPKYFSFRLQILSVKMTVFSSKIALDSSI